MRTKGQRTREEGKGERVKGTQCFRGVALIVVFFWYDIVMVMVGIGMVLRSAGMWQGNPVAYSEGGALPVPSGHR
jgi:hypothetical protein